MSLAKKETYQIILHEIERGQYEIASDRLSKLRSDIEISSQSGNLELIRKLLTLRLSIRNGYEAEACEFLDPNSTEDVSLKGEVFFVQGLYYNSKKNFSKSLECFRNSEHYFKLCGWIEKSQMSVYNRIVCEVNQHGQSMMENDYENLLSLQKDAETHQNKRVLGLIHRQKSYYFKDQQKWRAAAFEANLSLQYLELHASQSDYQIALLNLCDCYIELKEKEKALTAYERILGHYDRRIIFINDYIKFRLGLRVTPPEVNQHADPHFLYRWNDFNLKESKVSNESTSNAEEKNISLNQKLDEKTSDLYKWETKNFILKFKNEKWKLKQSSKDVVLIETLLTQPQSTLLIAEKLWPEYTDANSLILRLYKHISRINKKYPNLIISRNGKYHLNCRIDEAISK